MSGTTLIGTAGDDTLVGTHESDLINGAAGNDLIRGRRGDDTLTGGAGDDIVKGGKGNDEAIYVLSDNLANSDFYNGGAGIDTLTLQLTAAQWQDPLIRADIHAYLAHLDQAVDPTTGIANKSTFAFAAFDLRAKRFEQLKLVVDGLVIDPTAPDAQDDAFTTNEDTAIAGNVLADNGQGTDDPVIGTGIVSLVSGTTFGSLALNEDGSFSYQPGPALNALGVGETGTDSFTYSFTNTEGKSDTATVTFTITGSNDGPIANPDVASGGEDSALTIDVLANDSDADANDVLTITSASILSGNGAVTITGGMISYDPQGSYNHLAVGETATVLVSYEISDGQGGTSSSQAAIQVTGSNDAPLLAMDFVTADEDFSTVIDVLANDSDPDNGDSLTVTNAQVTQGNGSVMLEGNFLRYDPGSAYNHLAAGETASVNIRYTVQDSQGAESISDVIVTVTGSNDGPVAVADTGSVDEDASLLLDVLTNDTDPDNGDSLTLQSVSIVSGGGAVSIDSGLLRFETQGDFNHLTPNLSEDVQVEYVVVDSQGAQTTGIVTITVQGSNDAPILTQDLVSMDENGTVVIDVLANDTDPDGFVLNVVDASFVSGSGILTREGNYLRYSPGNAYNYLNVGQTFTVTLEYVVRDGFGAESTSQAIITVEGSNDNPVAYMESATTEEDSSVLIDVLANDYDPDSGDSISLGGVQITNGLGTAVIENGQLRYDPAGAYDHLLDGESEVVTIQYTVTDNNGGATNSQVTVQVTGKGQVGGGVTAYQVNADNVFHQTDPSITALEDGGMMVVWTDNSGRDGQSQGVFGQRYDAAGNKVGAEIQINSTTDYHQGMAKVVGLPDGGYVVAWSLQGVGTHGIFTQRYDSAGIAVGGETQVNSNTGIGKFSPDATVLSDGSYVVSWTSSGNQDGDYQGVYAQKFDASGNPQGGEFQINEIWQGEQSYSSLTALEDGGFMAVWHSGTPGMSDFDIYARRFDANGVETGTETRINSLTTGTQIRPKVTAMIDGGYLVTWTSGTSEDENGDILAQRFDINGNPVGPEITVNTTLPDHQHDSAVVALPDGGFFATWMTGSGPGGHTNRVYGQQFNRFGDKVGAELVVQDAALQGENPDVTVRKDGTLVIAWNQQNGNKHDIYAKDFTLANMDFGTDGDDHMNGSIDGESILAGAGNDTVYAAFGNSMVDGGTGNDNLFGNFGNNLLVGGEGDDWIEAGDGIDEIYGGDGNDHIRAEGDDDFIHAGLGSDSIDGGTGTDTIIFTGNYDQYNIGGQYGSGIYISKVGDYSDWNQLTQVEFARFADVTIDLTQGYPYPSPVTDKTPRAKTAAQFKINDGASNGVYAPRFAALANGGSVAIWEDGHARDGSGNGVFAQIYDANGNATGTNFQVNTATVNGQSQPDITGLANGGFVATWASFDPAQPGIIAQIYDAAGTKIGGEIVVPETTAPGEFAPAITSLPDGGYVISWQSYDGQNQNLTGILAQRFDASGNKVGVQMNVDSQPGGSQGLPSISAGEDGSVVVVWESYLQDGFGMGIFGQRFAPDGTKLGGEFPINTITQYDESMPSVAMLSGGGFIVTWMSGNQGPSDTDISARLYDVDGNPVGPEFLINADDSLYQRYATVTATIDGGFVATWSAYEDNGFGPQNERVYAQRYNHLGQPAGDTFLVQDQTRSASRPNVTSLPNGDLIFSWEQSLDGKIEAVTRRFELPNVTEAVPFGSSVNGSARDDIIIGAEFNQNLDGGAGNDAIIGSDMMEFIHGGEGDDWIHGGDGTDVLSGDGGNDVIHGGKGDDGIGGWDGDDTLYGGLGNDNIQGGTGNDYLHGGDGNDILDGQAGNNSYFGGAGADKFDIFSQGTDDVILDAENADTIKLNWSNKEDIWFAQVDDDLMIYNYGRGQTVRVDDWYGTDQQRVGRIEESGFQHLNATTVQVLVDAMSVFDVTDIANGTVDTSSAAYNDVRTTIMFGSWSY